jgi:acetoin utilization deacetylase AcuC-like enzyme
MNKFNKTGYIYDEKMCLHKDRHGQHPEQPPRIVYIYKELSASKLIEKCINIPIRSATEEEILTTHQKYHLDEIKEITGMSNTELDMLQDQYNSIYLNQNSFMTASLSAGGVIELMEQVLKGNITNGFAIVRPPGHHATNECMGFCLMNNIAIAANIAIKKYGMKRVLILDWDVHHGNGTQNLFYDNPKVLYISLHRYDYGTFYPGSKLAGPSNIGEKQGKGFNVNIAWNQNKDPINDDVYYTAFKRIIEPITREFNPELILVSAGFDSAKDDEIGGIELSPYIYSYMTHSLMNMTKKGKIILALEGGYNLKATSISAKACVETLLGEQVKQFELKKHNESIEKSIQETINSLKAYWKCLQITI